MASPADVAGGFYRVDPAWKRPTLQDTNPLLSIDGLVQAIMFEDGVASVKNPWIRTPKYIREVVRKQGILEWEDAGLGEWRDTAYREVIAPPGTRASHAVSRTSTSSRSRASCSPRGHLRSSQDRLVRG